MKRVILLVITAMLMSVAGFTQSCCPPIPAPIGNTTPCINETERYYTTDDCETSGAIYISPSSGYSPVYPFEVYSEIKLQFTSTGTYNLKVGRYCNPGMQYGPNLTVVAYGVTDEPSTPSGSSTATTFDSKTYTTTGGHSDYTWSVTGGGYSVTDNGSSADITFVTTGTFTIKVKATDGCGWSDFSSGKTVVVSTHR
jgi:hypothetical protein